MKKRIFSVLLAVCMVVGLLPVFSWSARAAANGTDITGSGTAGSPYVITSADQLAYVAQQVNANGTINGGAVAKTASYKLGNNIDLTAYSNWTPIGNGELFQGTFDGGGFTISNLKITGTTAASYGLFGYAVESTIKNVALNAIDIRVTRSTYGLTYAGGLAGINYQGTITNCSVAGAITGTLSSNFSYLGGLVGKNDYDGTVQNSYSSVAVSVSETSSDQAVGGGIVGLCMNGGTIENCYNGGAVTSTGGATVPTGGIAGQLHGYSTISNCYWSSGSATNGIGVQDEHSSSTGNSSFTGTGSLASSVTVGGASYSTLLVALNAWVSNKASATLKTWTTPDATPVFGSLWTLPTYSVTGSVNPGTTGASTTGLTVRLYSSLDSAFSAPVGSAITDQTSLYTINLPNGSYIARVAAGGSYAASVSAIIIINNDGVGGANITLARTAYAGLSAPKPSLSSRTDTQVVLVGVTVAGQTVEYGKNTTNATPTAWQDSTTFSGLNPHTTYYFFARVKQTANVEAGGTSSGLGVTTKSALAAAPMAPTISGTPTSTSIAVSTAAGNEYYISTSATADWSGTPNGYFKETNAGTHTFPALNSATQYYIHVRVAETETAMPSASAYAAQYTLPTTPLASVVTTNYAAETISFDGTYEVSGSETFSTTFSSGGTITPGTTYYVRVKAIDGGAPASEAVSFAIPARPTAPAAILAENITKTDAVITISATVSTQQYSVDGGNTWQTGNNSNLSFSGLTAIHAYSVVTRIPATSTAFASSNTSPLSVTTKAGAAVAPSAPTIGTGADKPTSTSITVSTAAGSEYYISTSATADWSGTPNGYFKETNAGTHTFPSLNSAAQYYIHVRVAETETAMPSASAYAAQYTLPTTPLASVVTTNYAAETISFANTYEVSSGQTFLDNSKAVVSGGTIQPETTYYVRVKAIAGGAPASEAVSFAIPARPAAPAVITADKTKSSITVTTVTGQEYKIGSGTWQDSGSFSGLSANTGYTVYARVKATGSAFASADYSISVTTKSDGSVTSPTLGAVTYSPTGSLAGVTLPTGWAWSAPGVVPTVAVTGYSAVYTPTDADTADYSGGAGYAVDGGGKVTITRTIPLTVNRATSTAADYTFTAPASLDYSGTAKTAAVAVKGGVSGMGAITVKYYLGTTETAPTNSGTYTVKIDLAQGENYAAASAVTDSTWTFTIPKVTQTPLSITNRPGSITYGDTFTLTATGGSGTGALTWAVTSGSSAAVNADTGAVTIIGVGETTITATKAADGNYTDAVTNTYTFTPAQRLITVDTPTATGGWTKTYDGKADFDKAMITSGGITNKVGSDDLIVSVQSAAYNTADVGSNKPLTITYAMEGADSGKYATPADTVIDTASITAAAPGIALKSKTAVYSGKTVEIDTAAVRGAADGIEPDGAVTYTYYTKDTCTDADRTSVEQAGAETVGGAPKTVGTYYVKATIAAGGNYTAATSAAVTLTIYYPSSSGANAGAPVIVDGKTVNIGTEKKSGDTTTVTVDQSKLGVNIVGAASGSSVVVPVGENSSATASLVVKNIEDMAQKGMTLTVQTGSVAYNLNTSAIDTAALAAAFPGADMSTVPFDVTIINSSVGVTGETLSLPPVSFTVTATHNGKTVSVDTFSAYMDRVIEVTKEQAAKITTAVVVNADGSVRHVPTSVTEKGGKYYAVINSRTNSTYALIQNEITFADAKGKWYEAAVNEMGSRKIIAGRSAAVFDGGASITRAEFSAILVRALGLPADGASTFADVPTNAWYAGAVATAMQYGITDGKGNNRFDPSAAITRQEAMLMLQRAAALTGFAGTSGNLDSFADANSVGAWARGAAQWSVGSGLIQGSGGKLSPTANITRAESATIILRLLQKAGLVDVRSKA